MPNNYELVILAEAKEEIEQIAMLHKSLTGANSAKKITGRIMKALKPLCTQPGMAPLFRHRSLAELGYRMLVVDKYRCFYRVSGYSVTVYHVIDGRKNYPKLIDSEL